MHQNNEQIRIIKLVNGDDIVCKVLTGKDQLAEDSPLLRLEKPLLVKYVPQFTPMGFRDYVALTKWTAYTPDKMITIPKDKIMTITNASEEMIKSYNHLAKMYEKVANDVPTQKKIMDDRHHATHEENEKINEIFAEHNDEEDEPTIH